MKAQRMIRCEFGDYTIKLEDIKIGIHSDETLDYMATMSYKFGGGKYQVFANVSNDGQGGPTNFIPTYGDTYKWFKLRFDLINEELKKHECSFCINGQTMTFKYDLEYLCNVMAEDAKNGQALYILEDLLADK